MLTSVALWWASRSPGTRKFIIVAAALVGLVLAVAGVFYTGRAVGYADGKADCEAKQAEAIAKALEEQQENFAKDSKANQKDAEVRIVEKEKIVDRVVEVVANVPPISCPDGSVAVVPRDVVGRVLDVASGGR